MKQRLEHVARIAETPSGWALEAWARLAGVGRTTIYMLPDDARPTSVRIGRRLVVTESPAAWLARMAARGGVATLRTKVAA